MPAAASEQCPEPSGHWYSYAIIRVSPRVDCGELLNVGVILYARTLSFLEARVELNGARLLALAPDLDLSEISAHLDSMKLVAAGDPGGGPIAASGQSERFHWLTSPRSTVIQPSPVHVGWCVDPSALIEKLMDTLVR